MSDPQGVLPKEAWDEILKSVEDPEDILSCSNTCLLFQSILSTKTTTWAFPLIFPSLMELLNKKDVLQCRLVSKNWLKAIDSFLQSDKFAPTLVHTVGHNTFKENFASKIPRPQRRSSVFRIIQHIADIGAIFPPDNLNRIVEVAQEHLHPGVQEEFQPVVQDLHLSQVELEEFIRIFGDSFEKNPFPSRAVVLTITDANIEQAHQFFNLFGIYIYSLRLVFDLSTSQPIQLIWKILNQVPNLKHLFLQEGPHGSLGMDRNFEQNLNAFLRTSPTPELKLLKWIEFRISSMNVQDVILDAFGNRNVTIFGFMGRIKPHHISANDWKTLNWELDERCESWVWDLHIKSFKHLHLPLESINLRYSKCEDLKSVFDSLAKYGSTLRKLTLTFTKLKNWEYVEMKKQAGTLYFSFLSQMKCLVSFNMVVYCDNSTAEFRLFIDEILDGDWIEEYLKMGGIVSGFRRYGFACISAGLL